MKHLKILIWNDNVKFARDWCKVVKNEGFGCVFTTEIDVGTVVKVFEKQQPDVVLLDIMCDEDRERGIEIAEEIRKKDLLIPIIAVTRELDAVYLTTKKFEELGFAGIYHASVMETGVFVAIALRPSLNQWHLVVPEFVLVRKSIQCIQINFKEESDGFYSEIRKMIEALPFSGSIESWHKQVQDPLVRLMRRRKLNKIADYFVKMSDIFEKADPFYMAGSHSRRHLSHNVQVFLIGLSVFLGCDFLKNAAVKQIRLFNSDLEELDALKDAVLLWACVSLTHDVAYFSEHLSDMMGDIAKLSKKFLPAFDSSERVEPVKIVNWPATSHGKVAAKLWQIEQPEASTDFEYENHLIEVIGKSIARHISQDFKDDPVNSAQWAEFLIVLSDEIQDWGRERLEKIPTWGLFCLEGIQFKNKTDQQKITFTFIIRDLPEFLRLRYGSDGEEDVRNAFSKIAKILKENLKSTVPCTINLVAQFVSRTGTTPILEPLTLDLPKEDV